MFRHIPVGSFGVAENADGVIDTVCRSFRFTAHQAVEQWGYGALPPEVQRTFSLRVTHLTYNEDDEQGE